MWAQCSYLISHQVVRCALTGKILSLEDEEDYKIVILHVNACPRSNV